MQVYTCLPENLDREFRREAEPSSQYTNCLDIERVERDVRSGAFEVVVVDPTEVTMSFVARLQQAVAASASTLILWTAFESNVLPVIVSAAKAARVEVFFRGDANELFVLRAWLRTHARDTVRAAVLRELTGSLESLNAEFAHTVLGVLLGRFRVNSVPALLKARGLHARWFERQLESVGFCLGRRLLHLGRLITAFDAITLGSDSVESAASRSGYGSSRALRISAHQFVDCTPSEFRRLAPHRFAERIVHALQR